MFAVFVVSVEVPASACADGTPPACRELCGVQGLKHPITPETPRSTPHSVKKCFGVLLSWYEASDTPYQFDPCGSPNQYLVCESVTPQPKSKFPHWSEFCSLFTSVPVLDSFGEFAEPGFKVPAPSPLVSPSECTKYRFSNQDA